jgi:uncharacterized protein
VSRALLDVNVLLALLDSDHVDHDRAHEWLDREIGTGWASCPITENGFVRIISQPRYPNPISPAEAVNLLGNARAGGAHEFWSCDISILDREVIRSEHVHGPRQVTDTYLLALVREQYRSRSSPAPPPTTSW